MACKVSLTLLYFTSIVIIMAEGVGISISGSKKYPVQGQPFTFTCTFNSNAVSVKELRKNGVQVQGVQLSNDGSGICYNVVKIPPAQCDPSFCVCNQQGTIFTASWTLPSINDDTSRWECVEVDSKSPALVLKLAVPVFSVTLEGISGSQISVVTDQSTSLSCLTSQSRPKSYIQWYIGNTNYTFSSTSTVINGKDEKTSTRSTLTFNPTRNQANLVVNCKAYNIDPDTTVDLVTKPTLNIQYSPKSLSLQPSTLAYAKNENQSLGPIQCSADCNPSCSYTWTGPRPFTVNGPTLSITSIKKEQAGNYNCTASNRLGTKLSENVVVNVNDGPKTVTLNSSALSYTLNETGQLGPIHCTADCHPECTYTWSGAVTTIHGPTLTLTNIKRNQAGHYKCTATNKFGSISSNNVTVIVNYGPDDPVKLNPTLLNYVINETFHFGPIQCTATCKPPCTYKWTTPSRTYVTGDVITISNIQRSQAGVYKCLASNSVGSRTSQDIIVTVQYAAKMSGITINGGNFTIPEHSAALITCTAEGLPRPSIELEYTSNSTVISNITDGVVLRYRFTAKCVDTGQYRCEAKNFFTPQSAVQRILFVLCAPRFVYPSTNELYGQLNTAFNITSVVVAYPKPDIYWYFRNPNEVKRTKITDGIIEESFSVSYSSYLQISKIDLTHYGEYMVMATNAVGMSIQVINFSIWGVPSNPTTFEISACTETKVILRWQAGNNGGSTQSFFIEYYVNDIPDRKFIRELPDKHSNGKYVVTLSGLTSGRQYIFKLYAKNEFGSSYPGTVNCTTTYFGKISSQNSMFAAGVSLTVIGCILTLAAVFFFILVSRKSRKGNAKTKQEKAYSELDERREQANVYEMYRENEAESGSNERTEGEGIYDNSTI